MQFKKPPRRIFLGLLNYGTQAGVLAKGLRAYGFSARSFTGPDAFNRATDVKFRTGRSLFGKIIAHLFVNPAIKLFCVARFDTFIFFYNRTFLPKNMDLPLLKLLGKAVYFDYLGWDVQQAVYSIERYKYTNAAHYKNIKFDELALQDERKLASLAFQRKYAHKLFVCAPYLREFVPDAELLPLAIDLRQIGESCRTFRSGQGLRIFHAPTHTGNKGTKFIEMAIAALKNEGYDVEYERLQGLQHSELQEKYKQADLFIDQILAGWYGTASIEAMSRGCPTICFLRKEYREHCPYFDDIPIVNADPDSITDVLRSILDGKVDLEELSRKSVEFVQTVHAADRVALKLINSLNWGKKSETLDSSSVRS